MERSSLKITTKAQFERLVQLMDQNPSIARGKPQFRLSQSYIEVIAAALLVASISEKSKSSTQFQYWWYRYDTHRFLEICALLDNLYRLCKLHTGNKVKAEKLIKNIIKIVIKIGVLHRNNQFNSEELKDAEVFKRKFQNTQLSIISFYEVDYSFDLPYLQKSIAESHVALKSIVKRHLTEKSLNRIDEVFDFFRDASLLETAFKSDSPYREVLGKIVADINTALDTGDI